MPFFVDLNAAFDRVNRDKLKMQENGISPRLRKRINEIYREPKNV